MEARLFEGSGNPSHGRASSPEGTGASKRPGQAVPSSASAFPEAQRDVQVLRDVVSRLEARARLEVHPRLAEASQVFDQLNEKAVSRRLAVEGHAERRREAMADVSRISHRQLSEIRVLRNPPDSVRRTIIATWLLLNGDRFKGRQRVGFDEETEYHKCQRMLSDEGFISRILEFDAGLLESVPHVAEYIARCYLGLPACATDAAEPSATNAPVRRLFSRDSECVLSTSESTVSLRAGIRKMSQSESTRSLRSSASVGVLVKPPLDGRSVEHASQPCGALFRWVHGLVTEFVQRKRNLSELESANSDLHVAQERLSCAEVAATELDSKLSKYRRALAEKETALERLQRQAEQKKMLGQVLLREIERDVVSMQIKRNGKLDAYSKDFVGRGMASPARRPIASR